MSWRLFAAQLAGVFIILGVASWFLFSGPLRGRAEAGERCLGHMAVASWYGPESGNRTATGDYFDGSSLTAAMPSRSHLGERWRVTYRGRSVVVLVNDLGPRADLHRGIDLSRAAARAIGFDGVHLVCLERL